MLQSILTEEEIAVITKKMGEEFTLKFKNSKKPPVFIGVMKGAVPFLIDLTRNINCPVLIDYIQVSSYMGTESTGIIKLKKDLSIDINGHDVVIVEDIIDSGYTLKWIKDYLTNNYSPLSITTCVLLDKKCKRKIPFECDYVGKEIGDYFIVGYGLDYDEYFRNERCIFVPKKEQIEEIDKINNR